MAKFMGRPVAALLAVFAASDAIAQPVTLSVTSGSASITSQTQSGGAWTVIIQVTAGSPAVFTVTTATANVVVEKVEVECDADCVMTVDESGTGTFSEIRLIVEKPTSSPESFEVDTIAFSGSLGQVYAEAVDQVIIGGDLGGVFAGPRADSTDSDISLIDVGGYILSIHAANGAIGSIFAGGAIEGSILARDGISIVEAESFTGNFNAAYANTSGSVNRFVLRGGDFVGKFMAFDVEPASGVIDPGIFINGDVTVITAGIGGFTIFTLGAPFSVTGNLSAPNPVSPSNAILIGDALQDSSSPGDITIGGAFEGVIYILDDFETTIRLGSLHADSIIYANRLYGSGGPGQIILAAEPEGPTWFGDVIITAPHPDLVLGPVPHYDDEDLIGAVGQVPFALHEGDCSPENGENTDPNEYTVLLSFYGPVTVDSGFPFIVEYLAQSYPIEIWADDTEHWSIETGLGTRNLGLLYFDGSDPSIIPSGREYRIRPILTGANPLRCDKLLTSSVVPVADFEYTFFTP